MKIIAFKKDWQIVFITALLSFLTYTSVYAFRKPFTVALYSGISFWGISYQSLLIISQVIGYMLSKFSGIRFIGELTHLGRWKASLLIILSSWFCLLLLAVVPPPFGMLCLFINGYLLGFMWGILFSYIEGRRSTDMIGAVMAISFIFAGGFTRSVALWIRDYFSLSESWIGFATGLVFIIPILCFLLLMERIPAPTQKDIEERNPRSPIKGIERKRILTSYGSGLMLILISYALLTIMRDIRDNFMVNMWDELGYEQRPSIITQTETITSLLVLLGMSLLIFIRNNLKAFRIIHYFVFFGFIIAGIASASFINGWISGAWWMQLTGLALYMGYIPFNCVFFERFIAAFKVVGNVGFLMYLADSYGYLGSVTILLCKELGNFHLHWVTFYSYIVVFSSLIGIAGTLFSLVYFQRKYQINFRT